MFPSLASPSGCDAHAPVIFTSTRLRGQDLERDRLELAGFAEKRHLHDDDLVRLLEATTEVHDAGAFSVRKFVTPRDFHRLPARLQAATSGTLRACRLDPGRASNRSVCCLSAHHPS